MSTLIAVESGRAAYWQTLSVLALAKFFHRILRDDQITHRIDPEIFSRKVKDAQDAFVRAKRELEGSANDATQANIH